MHLHPSGSRKPMHLRMLSWWYANIARKPIALIGDPSRSSYFYQRAMLVRFCPSPEPEANWGAFLHTPTSWIGRQEGTASFLGRREILFSLQFRLRRDWTSISVWCRTCSCTRSETKVGTVTNRQKSLFLLKRKSITFSSWICFPYWQREAL